MSSNAPGTNSPTRNQPEPRAVCWRMGREYGKWHLKVPGTTRTACGLDFAGVRPDSISLSSFTDKVTNERCQTCLTKARAHLELIR